jgi:hypothetical protein
VTSIGTVAFAPQITAAAQHYNLDPTLLAAVAAQETGGPGATSGANVVGDGGHGHGVFQIDDRYHAFASTAAAMDPAQNADYAAGMLSGLLQKYGGNVHAALSAYNAGSPTATGTVTNWGGTQLGYADSVLAHQTELGGTSRDAQIADLADTSAGVNELQSLAASASPASTASLATTASSAASSSASSAATSEIPPAALPAPPAQASSAQQAQSQAPLTQDYYADAADDGDTKGA